MSITAWSVVLRSARPPFLLLTPVMIVLATAAAVSSGQIIHWPYLPWVGLASLSAAIASNLLNEYFDFISGLDHITQPTPFSGGSKALIQSPQYVEWVKWSGLLLLSVSVWTGLYLSAQVGWELLLLGVIGVALVIGYTPIINRPPLPCLLAPGLGYGLVIFLGSYVVLVGHLDVAGFML